MSSNSSSNSNGRSSASRINSKTKEAEARHKTPSKTPRKSPGGNKNVQFDVDEEDDNDEQDEAIYGDSDPEDESKSGVVSKNPSKSPSRSSKERETPQKDDEDDEEPDEDEDEDADEDEDVKNQYEDLGEEEDEDEDEEEEGSPSSEFATCQINAKTGATSDGADRRRLAAVGAPDFPWTDRCGDLRLAHGIVVRNAAERPWFYGIYKTRVEEEPDFDEMPTEHDRLLGRSREVRLALLAAQMGRASLKQLELVARELDERAQYVREAQIQPVVQVAQNNQSRLQNQKAETPRATVAQTRAKRKEEEDEDDDAAIRKMQIKLAAARALIKDQAPSKAAQTVPAAVAVVARRTQTQQREHKPRVRS